MNAHDPLTRALRELPRERASPGFTAQVLARAAAPAARPAVARRWRWAAAALAALAIGVWQLAAAHHERELAQRAERLLAERRRLESELIRLRWLSQTEPVLQIAAGEHFEVVVGLTPWLAARRGIEP